MSDRFIPTQEEYKKAQWLADLFCYSGAERALMMSIAQEMADARQRATEVILHLTEPGERVPVSAIVDAIRNMK